MQTLPRIANRRHKCLGLLLINDFERPLPVPAVDLKSGGQYLTVPTVTFAPLWTMLPRVSLRDRFIPSARAHAARCICAPTQCWLASSQVMDESLRTAPPFRYSQSLRSVLRFGQRLKPADFGFNLLEPQASGSLRTIHFCGSAIRRQAALGKATTPRAAACVALQSRDPPSLN
jgi:hypothetical protein